jgi:hypothetical protein
MGVGGPGPGRPFAGTGADRTSRSSETSPTHRSISTPANGSTRLNGNSVTASRPARGALAPLPTSKTMNWANANLGKAVRGLAEALADHQRAQRPRGR